MRNRFYHTEPNWPETAARGILAALIGLVFVVMVPAVSRGEAILGAENCKQMTPQVPVELVSENDTDIENEIRDDFVQALKARGHQARQAAPVRMLYRTEVRQVRQVKTRRPMVVAEGNSVDGQQVMLNLWSSNNSSIVGGPRDDVSKEDYATYLMLIVEVSDNQDGSCVWRGRAMARMEGWRRADLAQRMVPPLIDRLGNAVEREELVLE